MARTKGTRSRPEPSAQKRQAKSGEAQGKQAEAKSSRSKPAEATSPRSERSGSKFNPMILVAVVGVAVVAGIVALIVSDRANQVSTDMPQNVTVSVEGDALERFGAAAVDSAIGSTIPSVGGVDIDGVPTSLEPNGTAKAVVFLAHWCPHCQAEVPEVQAYIDSGAWPDGVELFSIATSTDETSPNYPPSAWLRREGWTAPTLVDDDANTVAAAYGLNAFPFWVFVNPDGTVAQRVSGGIPVDSLSAVLEELASR